jgi:hypothetical protein
VQRYTHAWNHNWSTLSAACGRCRRVGQTTIMKTLTADEIKEYVTQYRDGNILETRRALQKVFM